MSNGKDQYIDDVAVQETRPKLQKPRLYKVILLNDDYTPMEFVIVILERFFTKTREEATRIMLNVHQKGIGVCGVYAREIAEMKVQQVISFAQEEQYPLQCTMEPE
ncbi:MAG: ATP-dependent Clp protease adapter ClpS [Gammaproteobacteria bacterium]|nr:MAG: ATP-dependent Clp protease adapter ClpS [Gammaproteobacteria bacterium]